MTVSAAMLYVVTSMNVVRNYGGHRIEIVARWRPISTPPRLRGRAFGNRTMG
jgi:hypothetical protein